MPRLILLTSLSVVLVGSGALAHHPFDAEYDRSKSTTIMGTVESFEWGNPHATIHLNGRDRAGAAGDWTIELGGLDELTRAGWTKETIKPGDKITVEGWMSKDGSKRANAKAVKTSAGKSLMAASSYDAPAGGQAASQGRQRTQSRRGTQYRQGAESAGTSDQLPGTATFVPLAGLVGLLSLGAALGLYATRRQ